jgi:hypothetical protein
MSGLEKILPVLLGLSETLSLFLFGVSNYFREEDCPITWDGFVPSLAGNHALNSDI